MYVVSLRCVVGRPEANAVLNMPNFKYRHHCSLSFIRFNRKAMSST
jgi:hypothetical protein